MIIGKINVFSKELAEAMAKAEPMELGGPVPGMVEKGATLTGVIGDSSGIVSVEDFPAHSEAHWAFRHDELHLILSGKAEMKYTLPPYYRKILTAEAGPGDVYMILNGSRVTWKVTSDEPYRHFCVMMPRPYLERWLRHEEY